LQRFSEAEMSSENNGTSGADRVVDPTGTNSSPPIPRTVACTCHESSLAVLPPLLLILLPLLLLLLRLLQFRFRFQFRSWLLPETPPVARLQKAARIATATCEVCERLAWGIHDTRAQRRFPCRAKRG